MDKKLYNAIEEGLRKKANDTSPVNIPVPFTKVASGPVLPGDWILNAQDFAERGEVKWVREDMTGLTPVMKHNVAHLFLVIRGTQGADLDPNSH